MTPEEYAQGIHDKIIEDDFDHFVSLIAYAKEIINKNLLSVNDLDDLITIMALDHEAETVLEYIEKNSSNEQLEQIVSLGTVHLQPEARWQIAELIFRRKPQNDMNKLRFLAKDHDPYVKKRAQNCIDTLESTSFTEE